MSTNLTTVRSAYEAFAKGDVPSVLGVMDPDILWSEMPGIPYGGEYRGPEAVVQNVFMRLATEWDGFSVSPNEFIDGGDQIVALGRYTGSYKASGISLDCDFAHVWTLRDGKAVEFKQYVDSAIFNLAMQP